jgi:hypothetical protein
LVDALVRDCGATLVAIDGESLDGAAKAAELLAVVAGQDVDEDDDGVFRIARRVAADRVISTVDTEARHAHKSHDRKFDGYKAHFSVGRVRRSSTRSPSPPATSMTPRRSTTCWPATPMMNTSRR